MWPNRQFLADSVTFTEEILNGKLHFLCIVCIPLYFQSLGRIGLDFQKHRKRHFLQIHCMTIWVEEIIMALTCLDHYQETIHRLHRCHFSFHHNWFIDYRQLGIFSHSSLLLCARFTFLNFVTSHFWVVLSFEIYATNGKKVKNSKRIHKVTLIKILIIILILIINLSFL